MPKIVPQSRESFGTFFVRIKNLTPQAPLTRLSASSKAQSTATRTKGCTKPVTKTLPTEPRRTPGSDELPERTRSLSVFHHSKQVTTLLHPLSPINPTENTTPTPLS
ncbi:hypothetical protein PGT21_018871 [Puccinia graminis f. sp. tritici]|uniref:Uncharacterized protein n=1 Tax=Puccinia graminis f. sp. tritici TaxID=56615 RepID=A0A5B0MXZ1_PUCGR|nr:hypothetical protein PGT21_018871 [Puccinia graminis f. sp. tritici]